MNNRAAKPRESFARSVVQGKPRDHNSHGIVDQRCDCPDVHILFGLSRNHALSKVVEEVKRASSKWMKTLGAEFAKFYWQNGYGAFSVSSSLVESVRRYIANQEEHHRRVT